MWCFPCTDFMILELPCPQSLMLAGLLLQISHQKEQEMPKLFNPKVHGHPGLHPDILQGLVNHPEYPLLA